VRYIISFGGGNTSTRLTKNQLLPPNETHDRFVCDGDIGPHGPDWVASEDTRLLKKIAFNEMPRDKNHLRDSKQRSAQPWSTRYRCKCSDEWQVVTNHRARAVEWVEVL
jgi:hypothetical protein